MKYYEQHERFENSHRSLLIDVLVNYLEAHGNTLTVKISHNIEKEILMTFLSEKVEFYRCANQNRGRIYYKFHNKKRKLAPLANVLTSALKSKGNQNKEIAIRNCIGTELVIENNADEMVRRMQFDLLSVEEFDAC